MADLGADGPHLTQLSADADFDQRVTDIVGYPDTAAGKEDVIGKASHGDRGQGRSVYWPPPGHSIDGEVRHPEVFPIESDTGGRGSHVEGIDDSPIADLQLAHGIVDKVCHIDAAAVVLHVVGIRPDRETAKIGAVAGPQFGHVICAGVNHPDIGSIESDAPREAAHLEGSEDDAIARP